MIRQKIERHLIFLFELAADTRPRKASSSAELKDQIPRRERLKSSGSRAHQREH